MNSLVRKAVAEFLGVAIFVASIVGATYSSPVTPIAGLALAVTLGLMVLLTSDTSGGHLNPAVTLFFAAKRELPWATAVTYWVAQIGGGIFGGWLGGMLWGQDLWTVSNKSIGNGQVLSEIVATAGLVWLVGYLASRGRGTLIPVAVAAWVFAAGTFTGSGAAANPAVTIGRMFTLNSTAAIGVEQGLYFILAQVAGVLIAVLGLMFVTPLGGKAKKKARK